MRGFDKLELFSNRLGSTSTILIKLGHSLSKSIYSALSVLLLPHQLGNALTSASPNFCQVVLILGFDIVDLSVDVPLKSRDDFLKSTQFTLNSSVCIGHAFDNDRFNFLELGPLIIELTLNSLLTTVDILLDAINHVFQSLVLLREQGLLMR